MKRELARRDTMIAKLVKQSKEFQIFGLNTLSELIITC